LVACDFLTIFDALPDLCLVLRPNDPIYTVAAANSAARQALTREGEIVGRGIFEVLPEDSGERLASLRRVLAKKATDSMPGSCSRGAVSSLAPGASGEAGFIIHRIVIHLNDDTTEASFSLAFAQAPIGMALLTPEGKIVEVNQAFSNMLGYSPGELISGDSSPFTHPEDAGPTRNFFASLREGHVSRGRIEKRYIRKDGEIVWASASATMRRDEQGKPAQVVAIVEDITARKRAETRYRFLAESIPQMVWTAKPDGMLDYVNGRCTSYFGVPEEALLGGAWIEWVYPEDREIVIERWQQSVATGELYETALRARRGCDGSWRWHLVRALPLLAENGSVAQWFGTCTDIDAQKQADAELMEQWHAFDTALSHTPDFAYTFDLAGRFTYVNRALLDLWQKDLNDAVGKDFFDLEYPPDLAQRLQREIQQVIDTKEPLRDETPFTGPSGETADYEYIFVPVFGADGQVRAVAGSAHDITQRNLVTQQIEDDRARWRELLRQTPAAIALLRGPEHTIEWVNPGYSKLVDRSAELLVGKTVLEAVPEVERQKYIELLDQVYRTGQPFSGHELLVQLNRASGELRDAYLNFVYLPTRSADGEIDGIFVHITDVTGMAAARKQLEESERQFRTLAETIPHLAWMTDETGNCVWYNRRWYDYTGTSFAEVKDDGWRKVHDPAALPEFLALWSDSLASGAPFETVCPLKGADGLYRQFLTRSEPVIDSAGRIVRWFGTHTDITEQRRIEKELRRINRELEEFAYVASHDLQEPLRMVNIYTQLILKILGDENERLNQYGQFILQGVVRMHALIHDLLTFSRSVHAEELPIGTADLTAALNGAMSVLKDRIDETGAVITAPPLPLARGDTAQVMHIFQNILSNALKYRRVDRTPEIRVAVARDQDRWKVSVEDNGIGFEPEYSERIFGLFKRLHQGEYPGTGLGLAICKRIVERYGGEIWAEGRPGDGATIYFSLIRVGE
jgi:PAS domain S-box-containing protein